MTVTLTMLMPKIGGRGALRTEANVVIVSQFRRPMQDTINALLARGSWMRRWMRDVEWPRVMLEEVDKEGEQRRYVYLETGRLLDLVDAGLSLENVFVNSIPPTAARAVILTETVWLTDSNASTVGHLDPRTDRASYEFLKGVIEKEWTADEKIGDPIYHRPGALEAKAAVDGSLVFVVEAVNRFGQALVIERSEDQERAKAAFRRNAELLIKLRKPGAVQEKFVLRVEDGKGKTVRSFDDAQLDRIDAVDLATGEATWTYSLPSSAE